MKLLTRIRKWWAVRQIVGRQIADHRSWERNLRARDRGRAYLEAEVDI